MRVLGIDPGVARVGYGVVEETAGKLVCVTYGCVTTPTSMAQHERLGHIFATFEKLIDDYRPHALALEALFYFKNQKTVVRVAEARGVLLAAASRSNLPIFDYTPPQVKLGVAGYGHAQKLQVQKMIQRLLGLDKIPSPDDAADGLAVAICCLANATINNQLTTNNSDEQTTDA